nr:GNAT family N-acetyltransferase [Croceicoccus mobilis]
MRFATPDDTAALADLSRDSFCAAFAHLYREEDLGAFLKSAYAPEAIAAQIADPKRLYRLAVGEDGTLLAYCKLVLESEYAEHSDARNPLGLGQLYTAPGMTGSGLGAALMEWALDEARERGCDAIQLSVWSENYGAQRFYQRYGFAKIADIDFWVGSHRDDEFLYELKLDGVPG